MITLTIITIIIIIIVVNNANKPDKKNNKEIAINQQKVANLPDMYFHAKELTSTQKALNLWPSDKDMLQVFKYDSGTQFIYLKMKDGRFVNCPLSQLDVTFDKLNGIYYLYIKQGQVKFSFYRYDYVFTKNEWDIILDTLTLAGITRNVAILGTTYKNMEKANTVLKIIKALQ